MYLLYGHIDDLVKSLAEAAPSDYWIWTVRN